jgi:hypothetical protein
VGEIGIPGGPRLRAVHAHGVDVGAVEQRLVGAGIVGPDPFDEFVLAQELARFALGRQRPGRGCGGEREGRRLGWFQSLCMLETQ